MSNLARQKQSSLETITLYPVPMRSGRMSCQSHTLPVPPVTIPEPIARPEDYNAVGWRILAIGVAAFFSLGGLAMVLESSKPNAPIFVFERDGSVTPVKY